MKNSVLDNFPLCPPAHPPLLKSANFIFIVVSLSLTPPNSQNLTVTSTCFVPKCDSADLLQNRETGKLRKWLGRVLGRVLRKFGVLAGVLPTVLQGDFPWKGIGAAPLPALPPAPSSKFI